jgi:hypothetical protein
MSPKAQQTAQGVPCRFHFADDSKHTLNKETHINDDAVDTQEFRNTLAALVNLFLLGDCLHGRVLSAALSSVLKCTDDGSHQRDMLKLIQRLCDMGILYYVFVGEDAQKVVLFDIFGVYPSFDDTGSLEDSYLADSKPCRSSSRSCYLDYLKSKTDDADEIVLDLESEYLLRVLEGKYLWYSSVQLTPVDVPTTNTGKPPENLVVMTDFAQVSSLLGFDPVM